MNTRDDGDLVKIFLEQLPKLDLDVVAQAADRARFEHSMISIADLTYESEVELVRKVIGDEFRQAKAQP